MMVRDNKFCSCLHCVGFTEVHDYVKDGKSLCRYCAFDIPGAVKK